MCAWTLSWDLLATTVDPVTQVHVVSTQLGDVGPSKHHAVHMQHELL